MKSVEVQPRGLAWTQRTFNVESQWTVEPDLGAIKKTIQSLQPSSTVQVTFLAEGASNKLYDLEINKKVFIMRVSLPVDPYYKTMSEVSTVDWTSRTANSSLVNLPIGFEWIIMTKMSGKPLKEIWRSLSFACYYPAFLK
ncbi:hypothetical protein N7499_004726 [Penicillium canescens]|uniref:Uncharacterized protein n=1 Tax=Penicillium canescens TaxID=5083 RepID=A0AAD6I1F8_PENCN|nr:uncharacterized protein N7446_004770 [Penicillium canescens]KAJ6009876.1 hypothetical protein N7522_004892 [Penicillium canescens]KAJ6026628.1 hypothetical protein N7460_011445 [Penicillium canescens]KAJ6039910.1 hypothetical protein N7444_008815 [Penicillium canescens]KAJ6067733.1 hypothetical protein N7446_004770 [Penicillium canescens]KAJ6085097.1 hypothetical protein N7499_004726 [Penicillium canescens]